VTVNDETIDMDMEEVDGMGGDYDDDPQESSRKTINKKKK